MKPVVERGYLILDAKGRMWDRHLYPTENAAETTASRCISGGYAVVPGKAVFRMKPVKGGVGLACDLIQSSD